MGKRKIVFAQIKQILFLEVDQLKDCMIRATTLDNCCQCFFQKQCSTVSNIKKKLLTLKRIWALSTVGQKCTVSVQCVKVQVLFLALLLDLTLVHNYFGSLRAAQVILLATTTAFDMISKTETGREGNQHIFTKLIKKIPIKLFSLQIFVPQEFFAKVKELCNFILMEVLCTVRDVVMLKYMYLHL